MIDVFFPSQNEKEFPEKGERFIIAHFRILVILSEPVKFPQVLIHVIPIPHIAL